MRVPMDLACPVHGYLWWSIKGGREFSQPPATLLAAHLPCGGTLLASRLRGVGGPVRFSLDGQRAEVPA